MVSIILQNGFQPTSTYQAQQQQMAGGMQQPMYTGRLLQLSCTLRNSLIFIAITIIMMVTVVI